MSLSVVMSPTLQDSLMLLLDSNLASGFLGACAALLGGWLTIKWSHLQSRKGLSTSLLAEIDSQKFLDPDSKIDKFTKDLLDQLSTDGSIDHGDYLAMLMREDLDHSGLVYRASLSSLGILPNDVARDVIAYWSKRRALITAGLSLMSSDNPLAAEAKRAAADSLRDEYDRLKELRTSLSEELRRLAR